eukprot:m.28477 g.28477  ORF g.28477 m.28477 type:complete len:97 (+) comp6048_c0_seq1:203-493(+)
MLYNMVGTPPPPTPLLIMVVLYYWSNRRIKFSATTILPSNTCTACVSASSCPTIFSKTCAVENGIDIGSKDSVRAVTSTLLLSKPLDVVGGWGSWG